MRRAALVLLFACAVSACSHTPAPAPALSAVSCNTLADLAHNADPPDRALFGMLGRGGCW